MPKLYTCGIFLFLLSAAVSALAEGDNLDLETILVSKNNTYLVRPYTINPAAAKSIISSSIVESLGNAPVDFISRSLRSGIQTDFSLRGSTFQGVLVSVDGQRINDPQTAHHNSDIPLTLLDIERIDIVPGGASSLYGPDAIGGAINIITKKPRENKAVLELSSGNNQTGASLFGVSGKKGIYGVRATVENSQSDGFRYDTDYKKFTAAINSSLDLPLGTIDASWGYQEKEFGAYDFYTPASNYPSKEWTKVYLLNTSASLEKDMLIKPSFLWRRHYDKFMLDKTGARSLYLNHHRTDMYTPGLYVQKEFEHFGRVGLGIEYSEENINSTNLGKHRRAHKSLFIDDRKDMTARLETGLSFRTDDFDGFNRVNTGSASLKYSLTEDDDLHASVSRSIRVPSFTELYYTDPTTLGDSGLSAEKSVAFQFGYGHSHKTRPSWGMDFFLRNEDGFIDWVKKDYSQAKWQVANITTASVFGIEQYLEWAVSSHCNLEMNYSYTNRRVDDQGYLYKYGYNYARHLVNSNFTFPFSWCTSSFSLTYKKKPVRRGWLILNAGVDKQVNKHTQLFVRSTNLLNVEYQEIEGIPSPGRGVEAGVRFEW